MNNMQVAKLFSIFFVFFGLASSYEDGLIVTTKSGKIKGFVDKSTEGKNFYTFHKIPYAEPPTGKLRFKNPKVVTPWNEIKDGSASPVSCPSPAVLNYVKSKEEIYEGEEDCLHLSVSTPKINEEALPVLLFIHGGGFFSLSGSHYTGHELMNEKVVYVAINYRLGVLGFLSTEDDVMPGNLGLKDQTMALQWVKENIKYFGGDPNRITIFGESAGSASVHYHLLLPTSKGLFNRAILQSGTALCPWAHSENKKSIAHQLGAVVGCITSANVGEIQSERLLNCLQNVDTEKLTMAILKFWSLNLLPNVFTPYVDGKFLPDEPETLMREGRHNNVDIMIGVTKHDGSWFSESLYSNSDHIELLRREFEFYGPLSLGLNRDNSSESMSKKVYMHYLGELQVKKENADEVTEMFGDSLFKTCSDIVAEMHSNNVKSSGNNVYSYNLNYRGSKSIVDFFELDVGKHWIAHTDDTLYLFPLLKMGGSLIKTDNDKKMRDIFTKLWTNFATTGNPTPDSTLGFSWKPFTKDTTKVLSIDLNPEMKAYDRNEMRQFWSSLPSRQNQLLYRSDNISPEKSEL